MSSRNATHKDFEMVINSIKNRLINPSHYVTHRVHFGEVKNNFKNWLNPANGVIKAMIEME
jgi:threonine dehydrogenase-like Zn-dependent dehydrogenase